VKDGPASSVRGKLLTVLGASFGLAIIVGNTIGAGILRTPGDIASLLPVPALFFAAWLLGALYAFGGANAICELATMTPRSGGQYHYARRALGPYAGFLVGWTDWLATSGTTTAVALVLAESVVVLVPSLGLGGTDGARGAMETAIAAVVIIAFTALLLRGVKEGARTQAVTSSLKAIAFLVLIGACVVFVVGHGVTPTTWPPEMTRRTATLAAFIVAMQGVIYTFDGWTGAMYFTEEMKDPGRDIPRATFGGLAAVTFIYLALLIAFVLVVPLPWLAGQPLAAGAVAESIFGSRGDLVVRLVIVFALPSGVSALLQMASRVLHAMSVDGLAPPMVTGVSVGGTPRGALLASSAVALGFLLTGTVTAVIAILAFFFVAGYVVSFLAVFVLRKREPAAPRPWRAWGHPWTTGLMLVGSLAFLGGAVASDPRNSLFALGLVVVSWPVYRWMVPRVRSGR
jgi:APA family basic amino acid/polyamine antiporter